LGILHTLYPGGGVPLFKPKAELPWPLLCKAPLVFRGPATARDAMVKPDIAISAIFPIMFSTENALHQRMFEPVN
jgi:hypothetical protein